jgi:hypothetical protein
VLDSFGIMEEEQYEAGRVLEVASVKTQPPPSSDMADVVLKNGSKLVLSREDFKMV